MASLGGRYVGLGLLAVYSANADEVDLPTEMAPLLTSKVVGETFSAGDTAVVRGVEPSCPQTFRGPANVSGAISTSFVRSRASETWQGEPESSTESRDGRAV